MTGRVPSSALTNWLLLRRSLTAELMRLQGSAVGRDVLAQASVPGARFFTSPPNACERMLRKRRQPFFRAGQAPRSLQIARLGGASDCGYRSRGEGDCTQAGGMVLGRQIGKRQCGDEFSRRLW